MPETLQRAEMQRIERLRYKARPAIRDSAEVRIVWRGGETTELKVLLPVNAVAALPRYGEMEQQVLALARAGFDRL